MKLLTKTHETENKTQDFIDLKTVIPKRRIPEFLKCGSAESAPNLRNFQPKRRKKTADKNPKKRKILSAKMRSADT